MLNSKNVENVIRKIKEGSTVLFKEKEGLRFKGAVVANVTNLNMNDKGEYTFSLTNPQTGEYLMRNGEKRVWELKKAVESGIVDLIEDENLKLCPICNKRRVEAGWDMCYECAYNKKKQFFEKRVKVGNEPFYLNSEQINALLEDKNAIVTARAGSGKTRVLTAKLIDLLYNQGLKEDEVLAFCFNRDAASEIRKRINSECIISGCEQHSTYNGVSTFHAYAKSILGDECGQILSDDVNNHARIKLVKAIINDFRKKDDVFERQLRAYFLEYTLKIDRKKFRNVESYYKYVRNSRYRTLNGEYVKSMPEKIIADFLFEHDIKYKYEKHFFLNKVDEKNHDLTKEDFRKYKGLNSDKGETVPDFYLEDYRIVWEHWGITGKESKKEQEKFSKKVCDYGEYKRTMGWKRSFWKFWRFKLTTSEYFKTSFKCVKKLLETDPETFVGERDVIELRLKQLLEKNDVKCEKLPKDEIMNRVWKKAEDYFTKQIVQFIDRYQQVYLENEADFKTRAGNVDDEREKSFLRLGYMVYKKYLEILSGNYEGFEDFNHYRLDFNQCLNLAYKKIKSGAVDNSIKQLKWILIDEYQDFSELFFNLIDAIRKRNPKIKFFCVGDDWQAINRFAGADLKFFVNFEKYFPDSESYNISINYRSERHIVSQAGNFMKRMGIEGESQSGIHEGSGIFIEDAIEDHYFDEDLIDYEWLTEYKGPLAYSDNVSDKKIQAYMKVCSKIINDNPNKTIMILNRKGTFLGENVEEIEALLKSNKLCKVVDPQVSVKSVHKSKGEEADIVILTEIDENSFPIFHPDSSLFSVFGEDEATIMGDETRLYYVALTRAKHSVYVFYSKKAPSIFIENPASKRGRIKRTEEVEDALI